MAGLRELEEEIARTTDPEARVRLLLLYDKLKQERREVKKSLQKAYKEIQQNKIEEIEEAGKYKHLTPLGVIMIITIIIILGIILYAFFPSTFFDN